MTDANELLSRLRLLPQLKAADARLYMGYQALILELEFVGLTGRREHRVIELFREHLLLGLNTNVDIKGKLLLLFDLIDQDIGSRLREAMHQNQERLGDRKIIVVGLGSVAQFIKNWLSDYDHSIASTGSPEFYCFISLLA